MIILIGALAITGCRDDAAGPDPDFDDNGNGDDTPGLVQIPGRSFSPGTIEVEVGTTVRWENNSNEIHTVTSGSNREHDGDFNSGDLPPGESFSHTFNETGSFDYYCIPHPGMEGTVTVVDND